LGCMTLGIMGAVIGYTVGSLVFAAVLFTIPRRTSYPVDPELTGRVFRYAFFSWAWGVTALFVWSRSEVAFLQASTDAKSVGFLTVGMSYATLLSSGPMLMTKGLLPHFAQKAGRVDFRYISDDFSLMLRLMALIVFPTCLGGAAIAPIVLPAIY